MSIEEKAADKGWTPKEDWDGDPEMWVDAGEFMRRGELMDRISEQTRHLKSSQSEIQALKEGLAVLTERNKKIAVQEYEKAMKDLKDQKAEALGLGDTHKAVDIDEKIDELKEARKELDSDETKNVPNNTQPNQQDIDPYVLEWENKNSWYTSDVIMKGAADALIMDYVNRNPSAKGNPKQILDYVDEQMSEKFPSEDKSRNRPNGTIDPDASGKANANKSKGDNKAAKGKVRNLTPEQRKIAERFVAQGIMTLEEYAEQLGELG